MSTSEKDIVTLLHERFPLQEEYGGTDKLVNRITPAISVRVATYQHVGYIRKCLDSILVQKTEVPIEMLIGEDESTDGTRAICIEYAERHPDRIRLFLRKRCESRFIWQGLEKGFNGRWLIMSSRGDYQAICEGDDYWTDPYKLQKQYDFMKARPECSLCFHPAHVLNVRTGEIERQIRPFRGTQVLPADRLFYGGGHTAPTASLFYRSELLANPPLFYASLECPVGDHALALLLCSKGRIGYLDEVMSVRTLWVKGSYMTRFHEQDDREKKIRIVNGLIKLLDDFDAYTDGRYADQVEELKRANELRILEIEGIRGMGYLFHPHARAFARKLPLSRRMKHYGRNVCPRLYAGLAAAKRRLKGEREESEQ